jgi:hypothetical protein
MTLARERNVPRGKAVAVDTVTVGANAAMWGTACKDTGEGRKEFLQQPTAEPGAGKPTDEGAAAPTGSGRARKSRTRGGRRRPTRTATSPGGTTAPPSRLAYKAGHAADGDSEFAPAAVRRPTGPVRRR